MSFQYPSQARHQVTTPYPFTALAPPSFPSRPGISILMDGRSDGPLTVDNSTRRWPINWLSSKDIPSRSRRRLIIFDMLPDDVLLEIFDFYVNEEVDGEDVDDEDVDEDVREDMREDAREDVDEDVRQDVRQDVDEGEDEDEDVDEDFELSEKQIIEEWITLAHVCRRWRRVVFQSPRRLNLRLFCTTKTCTRDTLDIWPPLPLIVHDFRDIFDGELSSSDNLIAALEHNDRVCQIKLRYLTSLQMGYVTDSAAMRKPFLELTHLQLGMFVHDGPGPILPDSFLGGTAPRLQSLDLCDVPFPGLPKLLLSTTHLVKLDLYAIPRSGYIPPEAMVTSLSALTNLEFLRLRFRYPRPHPALEGRRLSPPPLTRSIIPSLIKIEFKGASEYLEKILARIDAPRLNILHITFFNQIIFDTPQLFQFISRRPTLRAPEKGHIEFSSEAVIAKFPSQTSDYDVLTVPILCTTSEWQLSSLEQVCTSSLPPVSTLEDLYIVEDGGYPPRWQDDVENTLWLELLHPFAALKNLYLCEKFEPRIAPALQELVGGRTTEALPTLENIFLEGLRPSRPLHEGIDKFVAARQFTSHPVAVSRWDRKTG